jgi:hypothetical protein
MDIVAVWNASKEAVMAYPLACLVLAVGGMGVGWTASFAFAHREVKVTRILIDELRRPNISEQTREALLASAPRPRRLGPWVRSLGVIVLAAIAGGAAAWMLQPKILSRHLSAYQQVLMEPHLRSLPAGNYAIQINSLPNCDECEVYAQELRDFFGNVPTWKAGGGVINMWDYQKGQSGLRLIANTDSNPEIIKKIYAALNAAGIPTTQEPPEKLISLDAIIVVGRIPK